ncbi:unnamed protein product [Blepharisma stoltei]|uniref:CBM20 domain-containing protein n=1 Tax=Blepharisma stoltei TaxID=1481888 RepID=A0AAU9K756_9CILI|nr:unnamed protein product [Blepharisma stoltei]
MENNHNSRADYHLSQNQEEANSSAQNNQNSPNDPEASNANDQEEKDQNENESNEPQHVNNNKFDINELKKNPELYQKILNDAITLQKEKIKPTSYMFHFRIHYKTLFGERIVIVGSEEFLGNWDPYKGLELEWSAGNYWNVSIPIGEGEISSIDYKYVCIKRNQLVWEGGPNRVLRVEDGEKKGSILVFNREDYWQR